MALGVQFGELIDSLKGELEQSLNRSVGLNALDTLKYRLKNAYEFLWTNYDWTHLKVTREENLQAGQRIYSFADDLPFANVEKVHVLDGDLWQPVGFGIDECHYNITAEGDRLDPVQRWDVRENNQYEVWPTPASDGKLRMKGVKKFKQLVDSSDTCEIDSLCIVYFAAAAALAKANSPDAQMMSDKAVSQLNKVRAKSKANKAKPFVIGGGSSAPYLRPGLDYIRKA